MGQQNDYQFIMVPQQLSSCMDANCNKMLSTLIGLHTLLADKDGWFYRSNQDLQLDSHFSQNLVKVILDTLYQAGIVDIDCVGKGRGHRTNRIHLNIDSFKGYEQYSFNEIRNNPDLWIETVKYKDHYVPSYLKKDQDICEKVTTNEEKGEEICERKGETLCEKMTTNTYTIDTSYTIENNIDNNNIYICDEMDITNNIIEEKDYLFKEERNCIDIDYSYSVKEEEQGTTQPPCSPQELLNIYNSSFNEMTNLYPNLNYNLVLTEDYDGFEEAYNDIVKEYCKRIKEKSHYPAILPIGFMKMLNKYLIINQ